MKGDYHALEGDRVGYTMLPSPRRPWRLITVVAWSLLASVGCGLIVYRRAISKMQKSVRGTAVVDLLVHNDPACIENTGGTCSIFGCNADRGPTHCAFWHYRHRCLCQPGYCSGIDGKCTQQQNPLMAKDVVFRNAQWPDYHMAVKSWSRAVWATEDDVDDSGRWTIHALPVYDSEPPNMFIVTNKQYPDYALQLDREDVCDDQDIDCHRTQDASVSWIEKMDMNIVFRLRHARWRQPAVMFEASKYPDRYLSLSSGSWAVSANHGDRGPQAYWIPDRPLGFDLSTVVLDISKIANRTSRFHRHTA